MVRQSIITNLLNMLQGIRISDGYKTDVGTKVFEWREIAIELADCPCLIVRDTTDEIEDQGVHDHAHKLTITVTCIAAGTSAVEDARKIEADIYEAIGTDLSIGNQAYWTEWQGSAMQVQHEENIFANILITLLVLYKTPAFNADKILNI